MADPAQIELGRQNRREVRLLLSTCPGITNIEIGKTIGLSVFAVGRHVNEIRKEWSEGKTVPDPRMRVARDRLARAKTARDAAYVEFVALDKALVEAADDLSAIHLQDELFNAPHHKPAEGQADGGI